MTVTTRFAAIDIGTVTARLLVADVGPGGVVDVACRSVITHLGEGWTETGVLSDAAIERVATVVADFVTEARGLGATDIFGVATSASRDASNGEEFLARLADAGLQPEIITGSREAQLSFLGATYDLGGEDTLVVDTGGGSTELILGSRLRDGSIDIASARSIDVGSRRVTELFLHSDPPSLHELEEATTHITAELRPFFEGLRTRPREMIAVAGVATSCVAIDMALEHYDPERVHGSCLGGHALADIREMLASLPLDRRREVVGLEPARAGVIVAGALILETALALAGRDSTLVSEHDILYGMVLDRAGATGVARDGE